MTQPLTLNKLIQSLGVILDPKTTKLVRHQDPRRDIALLLSKGQLETYQANQGRPIFADCQHLLSFSSDGGSRSEFIGLYRANGVTHDPGRPWPADYIYRDEPGGEYWLDQVKDDRLAYLERRLVVDWGPGTRSWHQWLRPDNDKIVLEIRAPGRHSAFPGYDDVVLSFDDLRRIIGNAASNLDWKYALSKVSGVYLIQDVASGDLYVGSAYGNEGIWGRWNCYAETKHGNNVRLCDLCAKHADRHLGFRFSILKTMPLSADKDAVIAVETTWKQKLGTRAFGLNGN